MNDEMVVKFDITGKPVLSYDEWMKMGIAVKRMQRCLRDIETSVQPLTTKKQREWYWKMNTAIISMKNELENAMVRDIGDQYESIRPLLDVFYGDIIEEYLLEPERKAQL